MMGRSISVRGITLTLPAFFPVTTFGGRFPLDDLVRPYLHRLAPGVMLSYHYAKKMTDRPKGVVFIDSGGFASLFEGSCIERRSDYSCIKTREGDEIAPPDVLSFQEKHADIGATVDFLIPLDMPAEQAAHRQACTLENAMWALNARRRRDFLLFASIQAWNAESAMRMTQALAPYPFDGFALGGMVPRVKRPDEIVQIVRAIRSVDSNRPLHVFGMGSPILIRSLIQAGADSFDSSSYVRSAVEGKVLAETTDESCLDARSGDRPLTSRIACRLGDDYLALEGEANRMALALHNLESLVRAIERVNKNTTPSHINLPTAKTEVARSAWRSHTVAPRVT